MQQVTGGIPNAYKTGSSDQTLKSRPPAGDTAHSRQALEAPSVQQDTGGIPNTYKTGSSDQMLNARPPAGGTVHSRQALEAPSVQQVTGGIPNTYKTGSSDQMLKSRPPASGTGGTVSAASHWRDTIEGRAKTSGSRRVTRGDISHH